MDTIAIFVTALENEKKIRDLYLSAVDIVDDPRGKSIFRTLAADEQSHVEFLEHGIATLKKKGRVTAAGLRSVVPDMEDILKNVEAMKTTIPERMLGDVKRVLDSALQLEIETTDYYRQAWQAAEGDIKAVLATFVEIEQRHTDVVRFELDHASRNGFWLGFPELSMEVG